MVLFAYSDLQSLDFVLVSDVLTGAVGVGAAGPFSCVLLRLRGERSACFLSVPVGDLDPELQRVKESDHQTAFATNNL